MHPAPLTFALLSLLLAPLVVGVANRVKAWFAGRTGRPLLQLYYDIAKQLRKGAVYSETSSWVVRAGPVLSLAATLGALLLVPLGGCPAVVSFAWDGILLAYLLGLGRFFTVSAALDTGSAFEGMGASREVQLSALAEPAVVLALVALARASTAEPSLSAVIGSISPSAWAAGSATLALAAATWLIVLLAENSRVPFDDPNTHLELTMIHEVMVLDHSGPDLGFIQYGASLKLFLFAALVAGIAVPVRTGDPWVDGAAALAGIMLVGALVGAIESTMARLRLLRLPQLLIAASVFSVLALVLHGR
jgi:formate hydrogenlyase subunit 4